MHAAATLGEVALVRLAGAQCQPLVALQPHQLRQQRRKQVRRSRRAHQAPASLPAASAPDEPEPASTMPIWAGAPA